MKKNASKPCTCPHPPHRLYAGNVVHPITGAIVTWVACCACGEVIKPAILEGIDQ